MHLCVAEGRVGEGGVALVGDDAAGCMLLQERGEEAEGPPGPERFVREDADTPPAVVLDDADRTCAGGGVKGFGVQGSRVEGRGSRVEVRRPKHPGKCSSIKATTKAHQPTDQMLHQGLLVMQV